MVERKIWELIEKTKNGQEYVKSEIQFESLLAELKKLDKDTVHGLREDWSVAVNGLFGDEFEKLHSEAGGIVASGDDGFYMDFANWVLVQGKELVEEFKENGHQMILDYITKHEIKEEDYLFECMSYAFHDVLEKS